jgi:hypothetical protein
MPVGAGPAIELGAVVPADTMVSVIDNIVRALDGRGDAASDDDALLKAAFLFERARGLTPCGWPDEVVIANIGAEEVARVRRAVVAYVEREGVGAWALGKCADPALKPVLVAVLRRQLDGDAAELFQAMIALDGLGEPVFGGVRSRSILDESRNRELAGTYLSRHCSGGAAAG